MNVEITGLTRRFGRTMAVAGVDLQAGPGVFGLLGPNGAGKTSLLRMMATAVPPTSGRLRLLGRDPGAYGPRRERKAPLPKLPGGTGLGRHTGEPDPRSYHAGSPARVKGRTDTWV